MTYRGNRGHTSGGLLAHSTMVKVKMNDQIDLMVAFLIRIINLRQEGLVEIVSIVDKWAIEKNDVQTRTYKQIWWSPAMRIIKLSNQQDSITK